MDNNVRCHELDAKKRCYECGAEEPKKYVVVQVNERDFIVCENCCETVGIPKPS